MSLDPMNVIGAVWPSPPPNPQIPHMRCIIADPITDVSLGDSNGAMTDDGSCGIEWDYVVAQRAAELRKHLSPGPGSGSQFLDLGPASLVGGAQESLGVRWVGQPLSKGSGRRSSEQPRGIPASPSLGCS